MDDDHGDDYEDEEEFRNKISWMKQKKNLYIITSKIKTNLMSRHNTSFESVNLIKIAIIVS